MLKKLTNENFALFAAQSYDNPNCLDVEEFEEDVKRIKYIIKWFNKFNKTGEINERIVLNHLIVLYNVFETRACTKMLVFRLYDSLDLLKPFLVYLNYWPYNDEMKMNETIVKKLKEI